MIYTVKSRWDSVNKKLVWMILRGSMVMLTKDSEREAKRVAASLWAANDPWSVMGVTA